MIKNHFYNFFRPISSPNIYIYLEFNRIGWISYFLLFLNRLSFILINSLYDMKKLDINQQYNKF